MIQSFLASLFPFSFNVIYIHLANSSLSFFLLYILFAHLPLTTIPTVSFPPTLLNARALQPETQSMA